MKNTAIFASSFFALAGCLSPEQQAVSNAATCLESGYTKATEEFDWCMIKLEQAQAERKSNVGQALAVGLQNYGSSTQQNYNSYMANRPRQTQCYSSAYGSTATTNCTTY